MLNYIYLVTEFCTFIHFQINRMQQYIQIIISRERERNMIKSLLVIGLISTALCSQIIAPESLAVTIYNDNFAMVKDVRKISFDKGESMLYFTDVSANIQTETVTFKALKNPSSVRVYEQNFQRNLINKNGILQKYIEKDIDLYVELGGTSRKVSGKLLGFNDGYIVQTKNGIQVFNNIAGIEFSSLPDGFFTTPTLNWKVWSELAQTTSCQVAYRTTGFKWSADYSLTLNEDETKADIGGWVTIDNYSGKKYVDAKLKLIAGDVNTVSKNQIFYAQPVMMMMDGAAPPSFSEKSFADYHLYTLSKLVTLNESSQKQVQFIPKVFNIAVDKYHEVRINAGGYNQEKINAGNFIRFTNSKKVGLGIPFPKGIIRVFKQDNADGSLEFVGESNINHTPKDENITVNTGNAFDLVSNKIVSSKTSADEKGGYTADVTMTVNNHKEIKADVVVIFSNGYGDNLRIKMTSGSNPEKVSASEYRWRKTLAANQLWTLKWTETYFG